MKRMFRILLLTALLAASAVPSAVAQTTTQPGLGGEQFTEDDPSITSCNADGSAGTFTFEASGPATGPYPGTFTETGTVTVGEPDSRLLQRVTALTATFTIDSPNGDVTGTKTFLETGDPGVNTPNARCTHLFDGRIRGSIFVARDDLRYDATITTPDGRTCTAAGPTSLSLIDNSSVITDSFSETFYSDLSSPTATCQGDGGGGEEPPPPPPTVPTTKEQCKDAPGYEAFGFKNQGECIAFVERGPKKQKQK